MSLLKPLVRLQALQQGLSRLTVDRAFPGRIRGASIITTGPALGHDFDVDRTTVEQVAQFAEGIRGRWTHGGLSEDGLGRHLGTWEGVRVERFLFCRACNAESPVPPVCPTCGTETTEEWRAVGDFAFAASAHKIRPDGLDVPAPVYLMERAQEDAESLGISIVARLGHYVPPTREGELPRRFARIESKKDLKRGDWVADPAANPVGLHAGTAAPSELTEAASRELDRIVARDGRSKAKLRALAFLARYFGDEAEEDGGEDDARLVQLEGRVAVQALELETLRASVQVYERADAERRRREVEAFVESLRIESAQLNAPIPAADLERVEALLAAGDAETARVLGEAFLARSRAEGQVPFSRAGGVRLSQEEDRQKGSVAARARLLRRRGWRVELNADGTEIVSARAPGGGR